MHRNIVMTIILPFLIACHFFNHNEQILLSSADTILSSSKDLTLMQQIQDIPLPPGYKRPAYSSNSFPAWLGRINLKKDNRVFLYNGVLKTNQSAQFAVLNIPIGKKDLQQCADAIMRLRAQYLFDMKRFNEIRFADNNGLYYSYSTSTGVPFEKYLEKVFSYCGTLSLQKQLKPITDFERMQPGDVLIKGGSPGHAVIVIDMAVNNKGNRIYLLAQSYMPAQDIHVLKNPLNNDTNPWYSLNSNSLINTPEWVFKANQLRTW